MSTSRNGGPAAALPSWQMGIIAESPAMQELLALIERIAPALIPVLLLGETGTGKEVLARATHAASGRRGEFVALNCAALPAALAESELFGHVKGAFTGACCDHHGVFEQADGGTLLLDEIGELDLSLQGKLLRALEERAVRPVGASRLVPVDCRVIAATNRDLETLVEQGRFRSDLYYRLSGIILTVPPLRDRPEDIPPLLLHFLTEVAEEGTPPTLAPGTIQEICRRRWPGNVRELRQVTWRAVVLGGPVLTPRDFLPLRPPKEPAEQLRDWLKGKRWRDVEREVFALVLAEEGSVRAAARALGIPNSTFADRVRQLKLAVPSSTAPGRRGHLPVPPETSAPSEPTPLLPTEG